MARDREETYPEYLRRMVRAGRHTHDELIASAPPGSALAKLRDKANEISMREGISFGHAFAKATVQNPALYLAYNEERGS